VSIAPGVEAIVLDIEGTTTPIAFVYDVLFPFARAHLREFLQNPNNAARLREPLRRLHEEWLADPDHGPEGGHYVPVEYVESLMDRDRKSPALKLLQGWIWEDGYRAGVLRGEVFADVPPALQRWRGAGLDRRHRNGGEVDLRKAIDAESRKRKRPDDGQRQDEDAREDGSLDAQRC